MTEANASWLAARRAIVRSPLDRIGYGGYLSLAVQHPEFVDRMEEIVNEFRTIHAAAAGQRPIATGPRVAIVNCWGGAAQLADPHGRPCPALPTGLLVPRRP